MTRRPSRKWSRLGALALFLSSSACSDSAAEPTAAGTTEAVGPTTGAAGTNGAQDSGAETSAADDSTGALGGCAEVQALTCVPSPGTIPAALAQTLLSDGSAVALDVRGAEVYGGGHLPGARVLDAASLRATVDGVDGQVAPPDVAEQIFQTAGLRATDPVIVYGAVNDTATARVLWTLAYYGHDANLWILDGGLAQWTLDGRVVDTDVVEPVASDYAVSTVDALRVDGAWVFDHLDDPTVALVDARSPEEFVAGHIPGARSVDWVTNLGQDGLFLATDALAALYEPLAGTQTVVVYCQTGSRASVDWLVLSMLGYADVRIYDGSWSEWSANPDYPQE